MKTIQVALAVCALTCGNALGGELEEALFAFAESHYPQFFSPPGARTMGLLGYTARYYSETDTYLGMKDGWVYVYGEAFGGLMNVGSVAYYQGIVTGHPGETTVDLTGHWTGSGASTPFPECTATLTADLVQNGSTLSGAGTLVAACLDQPESGQITGNVAGTAITFGVALNDVSEIHYQGSLSANQVSLTGTYDWPDEDDWGTWVLRRQ